MIGPRFERFPGRAYSGFICDLDGVVYAGPAPILSAVEALRDLQRPVVYATNNASRPPEAISDHLVELGLPCAPASVVTSAQAGAWILASLAPTGSDVLAVGGAGVFKALTGAGFVPIDPTRSPSARPAGVLQGYGPAVTMSDLAEAAYAIAGGARWVATNRDLTLPTERGIAPGNGTLIDAVEQAVGRPPDAVAGKPGPALYDVALDRLGVGPVAALAIGDRLDTDIAGARAAGIDSLLVLTGVSTVREALAAPPHARPTYIAPDLTLLGRDGASPELVTFWQGLARHYALLDSGCLKAEAWTSESDLMLDWAKAVA